MTEKITASQPPPLMTLHLKNTTAAMLFWLLCLCYAQASGTWTPLANTPPTGVNEALVLSDGTILTDDGSGNCNRLTPDSHGSYIHGTWTRLTPMNTSRMFFSTELLTNGNVFVAGGEYGAGTDHAELYDSLQNTWTKIADPIPSVAFSDSISKSLPNGNVLVAPVSEFGGCLIYNVYSNSWQIAASAGNQDETCWVKLANGAILTIDTGSQTAEHYVPALNKWFPDNSVPVPLYGYGAELGAGFLLPNGKVFYIGATTNTAIYTPSSGITNPGFWTVGPVMVFGTNQLGAVDAPAAMMDNGKILCALGSVGGFDSSIYFYEYDYTVNSFTQVSAPGGGTTYSPSSPFGTSMLDLPDGTVLFIGGQNSSSLYVYTPAGTPLPAGQPVINSLAENADGSYHLTGTGLNGISEGAAYGDDEQMNSNYPLIRMTNSVTGTVYYARTYNWNSTGLQTGSQILTTEFTLPQNLPAGTYSLVAVANGNPSASRTFTYSPPPVPTGIIARSGSNSLVNLSWNDSAGATTYNVKRSSTINGYFSTIATVTSLAFTNTGLTNGLAYYYKVAAVGPAGPSSDSSAVSAIPSGPTLLPGATQVNLAPYYNRTGIYTDGRTFSAGVDGSYSAFSANLLEPSLFWNNLVFTFGPSNVADVVACAGQTINLPAGQFNTLQLMAAGVQGAQPNQSFTVNYTDNTSATFTQNFSDWANQQSYSGETVVLTMPYRDLDSGGTQTLNVSVDGYVFTLDQTKTVKSITLPGNSDVVLLSMVLANDPVSASLASFYNRAGIYTDGTTFTNPPTGGFDGDGYALSGTLLGSSETWSNVVFTFGPLNATDVVSCANQTVPLPKGNYSSVRILATAVNGSQSSQPFVVTYTDATATTFFQSLSDWYSPQSFAGESQAIPMSQRNNQDGSEDKRTFYLYGYSFAVNSAKTIQSIRLPNNGNVIVAAISLVPNWQPTFKLNPFTVRTADAGIAYSGAIATNATDLNADALTYAKVSGPAWLSIAANGTLSGTPSDSDLNTNAFVVSVKDSGGLSNIASLYIYVDAPPMFALNPVYFPVLHPGDSLSGTIATNASDPNLDDALTFGKVSGPAWLTVASNGDISGTPQATDAGTNTFTVSATDSYGLSTVDTLYIPVVSLAPIVPTLTVESGSLLLSWSGGNGPFQVQYTTNLVNPNWQDLGSPIYTNNVSILTTNSATFYRIVGN